MTDQEQVKTLGANMPVVVEKGAIQTGGQVRGGLIPTDFDSLWRLANMFKTSNLMPKGFQTVEAIAVAIELGLEVGLPPLAAVQNVAVINNRPTFYGDVVLGIVRASGLLADFDEYFDDGNAENLVAVCRAVRKGQKAAITRTFSVDDAKRAGLWERQNSSGGDSIWMKYPKRMLQMRARSWALRDGFGDVLRGLRVAEEVVDMVEIDGGFEAAAAEENADLTALREKIKGAKQEPAKKPEPDATETPSKSNEAKKSALDGAQGATEGIDKGEGGEGEEMPFMIASYCDGVCRMRKQFEGKIRHDAATINKDFPDAAKAILINKWNERVKKGSIEGPHECPVDDPREVVDAEFTPEKFDAPEGDNGVADLSTGKILVNGEWVDPETTKIGESGEPEKIEGESTGGRQSVPPLKFFVDQIREQYRPVLGDEIVDRAIETVSETTNEVMIDEADRQVILDKLRRLVDEKEK